MPTDLLQRGDQWLADQRREWMSRVVDYLPLGASEPIPVRATVGRSEYTTLEQGGVTVESETRDYIVALDALPATPKRGDRIIETADDREHVYEVCSPIGGAAVWRWADQSFTSYRIHTRQVRDQEVPDG